MMKFVDFFEHYTKMNEYNREHIPECYDNLGRWGRTLWEMNVCEGLVKTYPKSLVADFLIKNGWTVDKNLNKFPLDDISYTPLVVTKYIDKHDDTEKIIEKVNKDIFVYGYSVASFSRQPIFLRLSIEAKFPDKVEVDPSKGEFFHIAPTKYVDKILSIGLSPRSSTTKFLHPGGRIYLIQTNSGVMIDNLKHAIGGSKMSKLMDDNPDINDNVLELNKGMSVFHVDVMGLTLYRDPMVEDGDKYLACFTQQNIPPDKIELTDL